MSVVSIRIPDETAKTLHDAGVSPSDVAKQALEREARRIRVLENLKWLEKHALKAKRPTLEILREIRDNE